ncbi:MAG: NADH-quinone oxidoreductase subunit NuoF [Dehalococcoidia bacterium]|nr:NADH-quinone oxidoreductase subunit NuoF [Dehalococcoidia bacterium]MDH4367342.1 NADH-quinone oxidoreductase subunit NuoF [Dehalococcoidia bacterium]
MTYEEISNKAKSEWEALQSGVYILIGTATCGRAAGALDVLDALGKELARRELEVPIIKVGCTGLCHADPFVAISKPGSLRVAYANVTPETVSRLVEGYVAGDDPCLELALGTLEVGAGEGISVPELPRFEREVRLILRHCGYIDPENINHYIANGGYGGLKKALEMSPEKIIKELKKSGLRGRGGAGFPTHRKWEVCRGAGARQKYVMCNADEGDPGAFMDRVVLESDPHQVIEGMIIAGYVIGAEQGYIYVRSEYPLAIERTQIALEQARELGFLGHHILGADFGFDIEIAAGAGAFVSGEETALIAAVEGKMSTPRPRPPYPAESGLWGKPTLLNNVKTFGYVPLIVERGGDWFASIGTEESKGTAMFTLAGKVANSGLAEVPMGTTLRELVYDIGGGIAKDKQFKAVQIGGPSGGCLPESLLNIPIDYDSLREAGSMMGSGGMIIMDEDNCMVDAARFFLDFSTKESCGKCTVCRLGTLQMLRILEDITAGRGKIENIDLLLALAEDVKIGSLCGLGRTAPNPVLTTLRYFREEYEAHIVEKRCPARVCPELTVYYILPEKCDRACEHCILTCPTEAIKGEKGEVKMIDQEKCSKCGTCLEVCPPEYNAVVKLSPVSLLPSSDLSGERAKK